MAFTKSSILVLAFGLSSLISSAVAAPQVQPPAPSNGDRHMNGRPGRGDYGAIHPSPYHDDPFSSEHWPSPRKITGDNVTGNPDAWHGGHGGVHLHDPSLVLGPDGHYYSFSTHGLGVTSRATKENSIEGYWEIIGQVLTSPGSIDDPSREPRLW